MSDMQAHAGLYMVARQTSQGTPMSRTIYKVGTSGTSVASARSRLENSISFYHSDHGCIQAVASWSSWASEWAYQWPVSSDTRGRDRS